MATHNPFNPNSVVIPNLFAGRVVQVRNICTKLEHLQRGMPASFFVYGEKGIGKTALAKLILYLGDASDPELHNLNLLTSYYTVEKEQDLGSVLQESLNKLTSKVGESMLKKITSGLEDLFTNGKVQIGGYGITVRVEGKTSQQQRQVTIKDQTSSILAKMIKNLESEEQKYQGILIVIDEINNLSDLKDAPSILRNIVTTLDVENLGRVSFILVGYDEDAERFFSSDPSAHRTFDSIKLDVMPDDEAKNVLEKGLKAGKVKWDEEALEKNIHVAGGYPHSIQIVGHNLIKTDADDNIDQNDWDNAIVDAALELKSKEFSRMYSFNKPLHSSDRILALLASENKAMARREIHERLKTNQVYDCLKQLKKQGALKETEEKKLELSSQLLRTAILVDQFLRRRKEKSKEKVVAENGTLDQDTQAP